MKASKPDHALTSPVAFLRKRVCLGGAAVVVAIVSSLEI
jgi:hypothetical protein